LHLKWVICSPLVALGGMVVDIEVVVVVVGGDGAVVAVEGQGREGVAPSWSQHGQWSVMLMIDTSEQSLKAQQKWNMQMKVKMTIFVKWGGGPPFKKCPFLSSFSCSFSKNGRKINKN